MFSLVTSAQPHVRQDPELESEDSFNDDDDDDPGPSNHPLTARQAVKRGVVDSSHVSLGQCSQRARNALTITLDTEALNRSKKKQLNETELALKREETARKRKNLSEKKLEDEKVRLSLRLLYLSQIFADGNDQPTPAQTVQGARPAERARHRRGRGGGRRRGRRDPRRAARARHVSLDFEFAADSAGDGRRG